MTREEAHTRERALIDRHFARRTSLAEESLMRSHIAACDACRQFYERHLIIADLDPTSPPAKDRIASGLGFGPVERPAARLGRPILTFAGAAGVFVAVLVAGRQLKPELEFVARGVGTISATDLLGADTTPALKVFVVDPVDPAKSVPLGEEIEANDELAFTYINPEGFRWLMVLGIDEHRKIYWFHPAWNDQTEDPRAVAIDPGLVPRDLPEAITHSFAGTRLRIVGLFAEHELSVRDVERVMDVAGCASLGVQLGKVTCIDTTVVVKPAANGPR